ncbi:MAG TPA: transcriptional repressor [Acidimicrobiia bacterium]|nr:transcriptional repressor [Acidimicrobiia bacterium]
MSSISSTLEHLAFTRLDQIESRLTSSRRTILGILESAGKPMTVTDIAAQADTLVQSSLYRNLTVLEKAHLVTRIVNEHEFAFFELDEHVLGHHHHLRCTICGNVIDIELSRDTEKLLEHSARKIAKSHKFSDVEHHLDFTGVCLRCCSL